MKRLGIALLAITVFATVSMAESKQQIKFSSIPEGATISFDSDGDGKVDTTEDIQADKSYPADAVLNMPANSKITVSVVGSSASSVISTTAATSVSFAGSGAVAGVKVTVTGSIGVSVSHGETRVTIVPQVRGGDDEPQVSPAGQTTSTPQESPAGQTSTPQESPAGQTSTYVGG